MHNLLLLKVVIIRENFTNLNFYEIFLNRWKNLWKNEYDVKKRIIRIFFYFNKKSYLFFFKVSVLYFVIALTQYKIWEPPKLKGSC